MSALGKHLFFLFLVHAWLQLSIYVVFSQYASTHRRTDKMICRGRFAPKMQLCLQHSENIGLIHQQNV